MPVPELRLQVAMDVMGWDSIASRLGGGDEAFGFPKTDRCGIRNIIPHYESDWNAAMAIVDEIGKRRWAVRETFVDCLQREVSKVIFRPEIDVYSIKRESGSLLHQSYLWFYARPEHICEAALRAVMVDHD